MLLCGKKYMLKSVIGICATVILIEILVYFVYVQKLFVKSYYEKNLENEVRDLRKLAEDQLIFQKSREKIENNEETKTCSPHLNFAYIKTHKTGSSTIHGVFLKYLKKHKLTVGQKNPNPFLGGYPGRIKEDLIFTLERNKTLRRVVKGENFVLIDHFRFNYTVMKKMMPEQTLFISVARNPWRHFQSAFHYHYGNPKASQLKRATCFHYPFFHVAQGQSVSFTDYIHLASKMLNESIPWFFRSMNYQSHDLGLDPLLQGDDEIKEAVQELGSQIDLMMITDYMDESMVLLKDLLCMSWTDLEYLNAMENHFYQPEFFEQNSTVMKKFHKLYKLDIAMYNYFNATFWNKVDEYGRARMEKDVEKLNTLRKQHQSQKMKPYNGVSKKSITPMMERFNQMIFGKIHDNLDQESMTEILQKKISREDSRLSVQQVFSISEYMIQNYGGCPT